MALLETDSETFSGNLWPSQLDSNLGELPEFSCSSLHANSIDSLLMLGILKLYISIRIWLCGSLQSPVFFSGWGRNFPVLSSNSLRPFLDLKEVDTWNHSGGNISIQEGQSNANGAGSLQLLKKFIYLILFHSSAPLVLQYCHDCMAMSDSVLDM